MCTRTRSAIEKCDSPLGGHRLCLLVVRCGALALLLAVSLLGPQWALAADDAGANAPAAADTRTPHDIVADTIDKVTKILADPNYKDTDRRPALREQIRQTILKVVDMEQVARLTLAQYKDKFNDAQFKRFSDLFSRLVFTTYISHMEKYNGQKVNVLNTEKLAEDRVTVHTKTLDEAREIPVDYSLYQAKGAWKLYDVHIEGVSLVKNYRSQFADILVNKKPDQLNDQIEAKVKANEESLKKSEVPTADLTAPKQGDAK